MREAAPEVFQGSPVLECSINSKIELPHTHLSEFAARVRKRAPQPDVQPCPDPPGVAWPQTVWSLQRAPEQLAFYPDTRKELARAGGANQITPRRFRETRTSQLLIRPVYFRRRDG